MGRYALIISATNVVDNVIEYDGVSPFNPPTGQELREADNNAEIGGTWNGSAFVRAPVVEPTRTQVLMGEVKNPVKEYDDDGIPVNKTAGVEEPATCRTSEWRLVARANADVAEIGTRVGLTKHAKGGII